MRMSVREGGGGVSSMYDASPPQVHPLNIVCIIIKPYMYVYWTQCHKHKIIVYAFVNMMYMYYTVYLYMQFLSYFDDYLINILIWIS